MFIVLNKTEHPMTRPSQALIATFLLAAAFIVAAAATPLMQVAALVIA